MAEISNNFWVSCPKKRGYFSSSPCSLGRKGADSCDWFINSEADKFCFWSYIRRMSNEDGGFEPLTQQEIANLLGLTSMKIQSIFKESLAEIENSSKFQDLRKLFSP